MLAQQQHISVVTQFLGLLGRVTQISEQNDPDSRVDIRFSGWVSGDVTEKCIDGPVAHFDDVVRDQAMCFPVHRLQGLSVGSLGQTKDRPFLVIEPIRDITDLVFVLDGKIELVRGGDVDGRRARRLVSIKEQGHANEVSDMGGCVPGGGGVRPELYSVQA